MRILENSIEHLDDFIRLNEEWISAFFEIEHADRELAENPARVIENGGYIFSVLLEDEVVGVCALFNKGSGVYELARMAVTATHHGQGYGRKLIELCLAKLKAIGAKKVYLLSNSKLVAAISLYKKYGFKITSEEQHPIYSRANIVMEKLVLTSI